MKLVNKLKCADNFWVYNIFLGVLVCPQSVDGIQVRTISKISQPRFGLKIFVDSNSVCYWPPACGLCLNYEVVEFQPRTVTPSKI